MSAVTLDTTVSLGKDFHSVDLVICTRQHLSQVRFLTTPLSTIRTVIATHMPSIYRFLVVARKV